MDIFFILFFSCISFIVGVIATFVVQYYVLYSYFKKSPVVKPPNRQKSTAYSLPESLKKQIEVDDLQNKNSSSVAISLVLQFLFHELRHSEIIKNWLYKKLSLEFEELLTKTTIGKFFEAISIKDMNLGSQFPELKDISIEEVKLDKKEGHIDTLSLCLNLDYIGNFLLSIDAKMKFGKTAYLSIIVKKICGLARVQFTRYPYTYWSFSFYNDPVVELEVESHFQGRQLQSNITNLIVNQIKKAIKRKHTLPNYKIRYKPFFIKTDPSQLDTEDSEIIPQGQLDVTCMEVTRLDVAPTVQEIYCTMAVDSIPWICLYQNEDKMFMILELTMTKLRQAQLGVIFRQEQGLVVVESVAPLSCAFRSGLKPGDTVLAVENKLVNTVPQVAKLIKSVSSVNITLRVERVAEFDSFRNKSAEKTENKLNNLSNDTYDTDLTQAEQDNFVIVDNEKKDIGMDGLKKTKGFSNIEKNRTYEKLPKILPTNDNMSKFAQTIGSFSLRKRKTSASDKIPNENSAKNTPTSSGPGTPQHVNIKQHIVSMPPKKLSISEIPEIIRTDVDLLDSDTFNSPDCMKGKELSTSSVLLFNDDFHFNLKCGMKYLNVNVWGKAPNEKDVLLGYINIPLSHILNECCNSLLGSYMRSYSFLPPTLCSPNSQTHPLMSHSGFEHVFCFGDVLLSFMWSHEGDIELKRKMSSVSLESDMKHIELSKSVKHEFIRTQFHRTTHCDYCSKKIWLKDAVQCRECGLCCHKKCISKCQMSTGCIPNDKKTEKLDSGRPEMSMTDAYDDSIDICPIEPKHVDGVVKRVNSVNNLAIPDSYASPSISKSLPPSPQRTPSRKQSITNISPFALCPDVLEEVQNRPSEATECVNRLLEQVMLCPPDESLMDTAKETGQQLYANMLHEERVEKINLMMTELKKSLDAVTTEHQELSKQINIEESEAEKAKLAFLIGQADAKVHGLSVLMLHYCSSLQYSQEKIV